MPRSVRHFLFASLIACHAAVTLCGPCLHELPGSSHQMGLASKSHRPDAPAQSSRDSADNCLICHFVAQGQLTVATTCDCSALLVTEIEILELPVRGPCPIMSPRAHALPPRLPRHRRDAGERPHREPHRREPRTSVRGLPCARTLPRLAVNGKLTRSIRVTASPPDPAIPPRGPDIPAHDRGEPPRGTAIHHGPPG